MAHHALPAEGLVAESGSRLHAVHAYSAVGGMDVEDFHVAVGVIEPVYDGEIADDRDLELSAGVVKIRGVSHCEWVTADRDKCIAEVFSRP
jgi:hypothetical protein